MAAGASVTCERFSSSSSSSFFFFLLLSSSFFFLFSLEGRKKGDVTDGRTKHDENEKAKTFGWAQEEWD